MRLLMYVLGAADRMLLFFVQLTLNLLIRLFYLLFLRSTVPLYTMSDGLRVDTKIILNFNYY